MHLSCKTVHLHADRVCTADLRWHLPLSHSYIFTIIHILSYQVTVWDWLTENFIYLKLLCSILYGHAEE